MYELSKLTLVLFDIANGKELEVLYEVENYDLTSVFFSRKRKTLTGVAWEGARIQRHYFDEKAKNLRSRLEQKLPAYNVSIGSSNKDENIYIVRTYSDRSLGTYYLYDEENDKLDKIVAEFHSKVSPEEFKNMQKKARGAYEKYLRIDKYTPFLMERLKQNLHDRN